MLSKVSNSRAARRYVFILLVLALTVSGLRGNGPAEASAASLAAEASSNVCTGGRFIRYKGGIYYKQKNGVLIRNKAAKIGGKVYYFGSDARAETGAFHYDGAVYRANSSGVLYINTFYKVGNDTYFFTSEGKLAVKKWVSAAGKKYYFGTGGKMKKNVWVGNYYVGPDGAKIDGLSKKYIKSTATTQENKDKRRLIIVGASRVCLMNVALKNDKNTLYVGKCGGGYSWFTQTGMQKLRAYLQLYPKSTVVIQLGNNDITAKSAAVFGKYKTLYQTLISAYPSVKFYFMDALPGGDRARNLKRMEFNRQLKAAFPRNYIGGYSYLTTTGYAYASAKDKEHYSPGTYLKIYKFILSKTGWKN